MQELDLPSCQLEPGRTGDPTYERAMELMTSNPLSTKVERYWGLVPTINQCSEEKRGAIRARIRSAIEMIPRVRDLIYKDILLKRELGQTISNLDEYLLLEEYPKKLGLAQREYQIAASHVFFRQYAEILSNCQEPEERKHFGPLKYFGTVHDLLVGIKTGKYYFIVFACKGEIDLNLIEKINIPVVFANEEEVFSAQMKVLLEGGGATPLRKAAGETYSVLSFRPDSEKEGK